MELVGERTSLAHRRGKGAVLVAPSVTVHRKHRHGGGSHDAAHHHHPAVTVDRGPPAARAGALPLLPTPTALSVSDVDAVSVQPCACACGARMSERPCAVARGCGSVASWGTAVTSAAGLVPTSTHIFSC
jgi:hypothetical protein